MTAINVRVKRVDAETGDLVPDSMTVDAESEAAAEQQVLDLFGPGTQLIKGSAEEVPVMEAPAPTELVEVPEP